MKQTNIMSRCLLLLSATMCVFSLAFVVFAPARIAEAQRFTSSGEEKKCETGENPSSQQVRECIADNGIVKIINAFIAMVAAVAGIAITGMIIAGGIQYSAAGGNQASVEKARKKIGNAILALIAFIFLGAFLEWLVPGGLVR